MIWFSSSVEVTVATVSTIVYQYDNTAVTSYETTKANSTTTFPAGTFQNFAISGVLSALIGTNLGVYGTEWTDSYGVVYTSPTPVYDYGWIDYK